MGVDPGSRPSVTDGASVSQNHATKKRVTRARIAATLLPATRGISPAAARRNCGSVTEYTMFTDCDGLTGDGMIVSPAYQPASVSVVRVRETTSPAAGVARANRTSPM